MKDNDGILTGKSYSLAHRESRDGFDWRPAKHVFVPTPEIAWTDGTRKKLNALERPQLIFDARGTAPKPPTAPAASTSRARSAPRLTRLSKGGICCHLISGNRTGETKRFSAVERGPGSRARVGFDR